MTATMITSRPARASEREEVIRMCLDAFADEAVIAWVFPDPRTRQGQMRALFTASLGQAIDAGMVFLAVTADDEPIAGSIWVPRSDPAHATRSAETSHRSAGADALPAPAADVPEADAPAADAAPADAAQADAAQADPRSPISVDETASRRLGTLQELTDARHPGAAHLYLSSMAVRPDHRRRGAGGAMIRAGLERARELGMPAYLEASTPENAALYRRHGFADVGGPISLPEGGPTLQPMWLDRGEDVPASA